MTTNYLDAAIETALEAGKILREEYALPPDIRYKGDVDLVTQADKRSETAIVTRLSRLFPEHTIAAEEGTGHVRSSEFHWHVDPLDGTTNFAHKYPCFAVSIALAQNGTVIAGVVYNPIYDELFAAARGEGATLNGKQISVSKIETPWDTAAGVLLVQEAGGTISDFQGRPYALGGPVILATNSLIHEEMRETALAISQRDPAAPLQAPTRTIKE